MLLLKQKNTPAIVSILIANCIYIFLYIFNGDLSIVESIYSINIKNISMPSIIFIITLTITSLISGDKKSILIFWRTKNIFPGHFAFTKFINTDSRINKEVLECKYGQLPTDFLEQNRLWYKMYRDVCNAKHIEQLHKHFLLFRDCFFMMLVVFMCTLAFVVITNILLLMTHYIYFLPLIAQILLFMNAARVHGISFVKNVMVEATIQWGS